VPYLRIRETDLFYREYGAGPLAVFLHAYMTDHTMWLDQMRGLGDRRRCVAVDLRGFGRSDPIAPGYLDYEIYADDVAELIHQLGEEQADVAGFSAGGTIALVLWRRHPDLIRSLVLMTPGVGGAMSAPAPDAPAPVPGERGAPDYLDANSRRAVFEGKAALFDRFQVAGYHFGPHASLTAKARYRSMFEGTRTDMMVSTFQTLARQTDYSDILPKITAPVLFIRGVDESMPLSRVREIAALIPDARIVEVPTSGRFVMLENPDATTAAMREFWTAEPAPIPASNREGAART
jgi:3-oxoadipate enol-lactonase